MSFLLALELIGTFAFAASGAFAAIDKKLDAFGVIIISFVTSIGGGTVRDLIIGSLPVAWLSNHLALLVVFLTAILVMLFSTFIRRFSFLLFISDAAGLGLFTLIGIEKGVAHGFSPGICIVLGTITGSFGGVIRDVLLNSVPLIFRKEIYASACVTGGIVYFLLMRLDVNFAVVEILVIVLIVLIRLLAVHYKWALPVLVTPGKSRKL
ncbi:MAG: trimeric intracellular cation channel family protein [Chitinophagaceae bacterium]|nr:trimeric intracellular cation channel family protein [Chitinophagaceae bacterium]